MIFNLFASFPLVRYEKAPDVEAMLEDIIKTLNFKHVINARLIGIRSFGSRSDAIARIWAFPKIWQTALDIGPFYVVEVISERFDKLSNKEKIKTLIHELLHIPKSFGGGLLGHKQGNISERREEELYKEYIRRKLRKGSP